MALVRSADAEFFQRRGVPLQRVQELDARGVSVVRDQRREERVVHPAPECSPFAQFTRDHGVVGRREGVSGYRGHHERGRGEGADLPIRGDRLAARRPDRGGDQHSEQQVGGFSHRDLTHAEWRGRATMPIFDL